ncbi:hypothetical protein [Helicobacter sp.]|uniref:hypothetical protein n=1 Tax=Helicobacter sp. TaxID=218 RepID=UPI0025BBD8B1|nr:hypothetical protein [Helicobacter sp.]MCI5968282.1 hypothetical protein [Helicobacter sp.]MDY2585374.1 hypothetical protein [Helicobacter sp.]
MRKILLKIFGLLLCGVSLKAQPWVMFSDKDDTYLYDQASGNVYIRIKKGGKNYEDTFVKMGVLDSINGKKKSVTEPKNTESKSELEEQKKLLKQAQELQRSIQGALLGGE